MLYQPSSLESSQLAESAERPRRRRFSRERKLALLAEADRCVHPEQVTALLAREGLHCSHLTVWRKQLERSQACGQTQRARKSRVAEFSQTIDKLEHEKAELERELLLARRLLELRGPANTTQVSVPVALEAQR